MAAHKFGLLEIFGGAYCHLVITSQTPNHIDAIELTFNRPLNMRKLVGHSGREEN